MAPTMINDILDDDSRAHLRADNVTCQTYQVDFLKRSLLNIRFGHKFSVVHLNCRSLSCHYDELTMLLDHLKWHPDIIVTTELGFRKIPV